MEEKLSNNDGANAMINIGAMLRILCAPPYGCNIASVGLLLALFLGVEERILTLFTTAKLLVLKTGLMKP